MQTMYPETSIASAAQKRFHVWSYDHLPMYTGHQQWKKCVMLIDDSPTVRKIIETCLRRDGFEVFSFSDGVEAIRWLIHPETSVPDLILLDIGLPKMDGYEVARHLKSKPSFRATPLVMLSRRDGMIDKLKGRLVGAKAYLTKPFTTRDLIAVVETYLGKCPEDDDGYA